MTDFWKGVFYGTIASGVVGLYTSLFLQRWTKFRDLKLEARRILNGFEYIGSGTDVEIRERKDMAELMSVSGDLHAFGHHDAANTIASIFTELRETQTRTHYQQLDVATIMSRMERWSTAISSMRPSLRAILHPSPMRMIGRNIPLCARRMRRPRTH